MDEIRIPEGLLPKSVKSPAAFIADKHPELPDYGITTGDLVVIDREERFTVGELSVFISDDKEMPLYHLSNRIEEGYSEHAGRVVMVIKYYDNSPLETYTINRN